LFRLFVFRRVSNDYVEGRQRSGGRQRGAGQGIRQKYVLQRPEREVRLPDEIRPAFLEKIYDSDLSAICRKYLYDLATGTSDLNSMLRKAEEETNQAVAP
jgi:hypothetical protein